MDYMSQYFNHHYNFINAKKAFKKLYMFYFETFQIILNPPLVKKQKHVVLLWQQKHMFLL